MKKRLSHYLVSPIHVFYPAKSYGAYLTPTWCSPWYSLGGDYSDSTPDAVLVVSTAGLAIALWYPVHRNFSLHWIGKGSRGGEIIEGGSPGGWVMQRLERFGWAHKIAHSTEVVGNYPLFKPSILCHFAIFLLELRYIVTRLLLAMLNFRVAYVTCCRVLRHRVRDGSVTSSAVPTKSIDGLGRPDYH